jgi:hypothetical protein
MSRRTIEAFGAAVLLLVAIPSAMSLLLVGLPGMVLVTMTVASLAVRNLVVVALLAMFALGHWLVLQEDRRRVPDAHRREGPTR